MTDRGEEPRSICIGSAIEVKRKPSSVRFRRNWFAQRAAVNRKVSYNRHYLRRRTRIGPTLIGILSRAAGRSKFLRRAIRPLAGSGRNSQRNCRRPLPRAPSSADWSVR